MMESGGGTFWLVHFSISAITMLRKTVLAGVLVAFAALNGRATAQISPLVSESAAQRHGLVRRWFVQINADRSAGGITYISQQSGLLLIQAGQATLSALDPETGRTLWTTEVGRRDRLSLAPSASATYVATMNGSILFLLDRVDGKVKWSQHVGGVPGAGPALTDTHVFVPMVNGLVEAYALDAPKQRPWIYKSAGRVLIQPMVTPGHVSWTTDRGYFYVADTTEVAIRFRLEATNAIEARPAYWWPYVYACSLDGNVYAVNESSGRFEWKFPAGSPISQPPVAINGKVYVVGDDSIMYCLDGKTPPIGLERCGAGQFVAVTPTRVYAVDDLGSLVALEPTSGASKIRWPCLELARNSSTLSLTAFIWYQIMG